VVPDDRVAEVSERERTMKTSLAVASLAAAMLVITFSAPAFAQGGNIGGVESAGAPRNSSIIMSQRPRDGTTYHRRVVVKKKKPSTTVKEPVPPPRGY
jgi:hypothetical protein